MILMLEFEEDPDVTCKKNTYTIHKEKTPILLKKISIKKQQLSYAFIGGMWYTKDKFSFNQNISLPHPFTTYYTIKIQDEHIDETICRSLLYVKTPLCILQLQDTCYAITFDPTIILNKHEIFPFISLKETEDTYEISFYLFTTYTLKEKENAWLGFGKIQKKHIPIKQNDTFDFNITVHTYHQWTEAVETYVKNQLPKKKDLPDTLHIYQHAKQALYRSYDHRTGCFLQLPWRKTPGFTFAGSSYSLLSYEAVRLHYFSKLYQQTHERDYEEWSKQLVSLFKNKKLYTKPHERGTGIIWYNMTTLTRTGLLGYFYMGCGYAGYPGGQATIAYHLLCYLEDHTDDELSNLVQQSLSYILSTQHENGSWPMALKQEGHMILRPEQLDQYETSGGTAESVRALLKGYEKFHDETMKTQALQALDFLTDAHPICYNGLRDIGINEPEAFSVISIIHAFLDGYKLTQNKEYLDQAITYAYYALPWFYLYNTQHLNIKFQFHPISYSITPRLSPYETIWIVHLFKRLATITKNDLWEQLAQISYQVTLPWISDTGGLSEGIFPKSLNSLKRLPMEQTFATTELLYTSFQLLSHQQKRKQEQEKQTSKTKDTKDLQIIQNDDTLQILYKKELIAIFDVDQWSLPYIKDADLGKQGIFFSFSDAYTNRNRSRQKIFYSNRGIFGRYILALENIPYYLKGVEGPVHESALPPTPIGKHLISKTIQTQSPTKIHIEGKTQYHELSFTIQVFKDKQGIHLLIDPLRISVRAFDLTEKQRVILPCIDAQAQKISDTRLTFPHFYIEGYFPQVKQTERYTEVDHTLTTNWTHGGLFTSSLDIVLPLHSTPQKTNKSRKP